MGSSRDPVAALAPASQLLALRQVPAGAPRWCFPELAGRLVEISGWRSSAVYTCALALVADAQRSGETAAWIGPRARTFFPPDAHEAGVDLDALPVVRVERAADVPVAADLLARSGGFAVLVLDVGAPGMPLGALSRLAGLARKHDAAILLLTEKSPEHPSLGSVVSLRACASFERSEGGFSHSVAVSRDRLRMTSWRQVDPRRGPPGLS